MKKNVLYKKNIVPAAQSPDGETPTAIWVTEEVNGYAVWLTGHDEGTILLDHFHYPGKDAAIEAGVDFARMEDVETILAKSRFGWRDLGVDKQKQKIFSVSFGSQIDVFRMIAKRKDGFGFGDRFEAHIEAHIMNAIRDWYGDDDARVEIIDD